MVGAIPDLRSECHNRFLSLRNVCKADVVKEDSTNGRPTRNTAFVSLRTFIRGLAFPDQRIAGLCNILQPGYVVSDVATVQKKDFHQNLIANTRSSISDLSTSPINNFPMQ